MNRRGFLSSILVAAAAPAIVRADSLMRIVPVETTLLLEEDVLRAAFNDGYESGRNPGDTIVYRRWKKFVDTEYGGLLYEDFRVRVTHDEYLRLSRGGI